jgi:hypothetical protein
MKFMNAQPRLRLTKDVGRRKWNDLEHEVHEHPVMALAHGEAPNLSGKGCEGRIRDLRQVCGKASRGESIGNRV